MKFNLKYTKGFLSEFELVQADITGGNIKYYSARVKKSGGSFQLSSNPKTINFQEHLSKIKGIKEGVPVFLIVTGQKVLSKQLPSTTEQSAKGLKKTLPFFKEDQLLFDFNSSDNGLNVNIIKKDSLNPIYESITSIGAVVCGLKIDKEPVFLLSEQDSIVESSRHLELLLNNFSKSDKTLYVKKENIQHNFKLIGLSFFTKKLYPIAIASVLAILIINFLLFSSFSKKLSSAQTGSNQTYTASNLQSLKNDYNNKKDFLLKSGLSSEQLLWFWADQLAGSVPSEITLHTLDFFPLSTQSRPYSILSDTVKVMGATLEQEAITNWTWQLDSLMWTSEVNLKNVKRNEKTRQLWFEILISTIEQ